MCTLNQRKGFTLVELLVALTLATIGAALAMQLWFQFFATLLDRQKSAQRTMGRELGILALESRLAQGCGLVSVAADRLEWADCTGETHRLEQDGDSVRLDGQVILASSARGISFTLHGPRFDRESNDSIWIPWKELDYDRNGFLDFGELDKDYSRSLEGRELLYANLLIVHVESPDSPAQDFLMLVRTHTAKP